MAEQHAEVISIAEQRAAREARLAGTGDRPRCAAETVEGRRCRNYAVSDGRCRVHAPREAEPATTPSGPAATPSRRDDLEERAAGHPRASRTPRASRGRRDADEVPTSRHDRDAEAAFARAERELARRGLGPAIDGLAALRDATDERWLDTLRKFAEVARRRLIGDYDVDEFGFDEDLTTNLMMPLLRPLHRHYWRVTSHGTEHIPQDDGALLVANHAGTLPADALITRLDVFDRTGRHARELGADLVFRTPFVGEFARKTGATLASGDDADRLLAAGELVAVWPEGFKGLGKPWRDRYKLQRFGRGGFVATALRAQVPIVPTAIVGSEEIYPMLFDLRLLARLLDLPYLPVVAQLFALPVLGPFALLPLPSKWIIEYGRPIDTVEEGPELADDPMAVFDLTDQVRGEIQAMLHQNLMGRRSVFL